MVISNTVSVTDDEKKKVWDLFSRFDYIPYQQFPEYPAIEGLKARAFIAREGEHVIGFVQAIEKKNILVSIEFGPMGIDADVVGSLLQHVLSFYSRKFFSIVRWIPFCYSEEQYRQIDAMAGRKFQYISAERQIHWASKRIALDEPDEMILKKFSENHRRSIKKGIAAIECRVVEDAQLTTAFANGYINMYKHRKLAVDEGATHASFRKLHAYLSETGRGFFLGAFIEGELTGGLIIIYQGESAFYYKGFTDHTRRQLPVNHVAFYNAILQSKKDNRTWFDFGGYALDTTDEQLANINKFKDGFKGELVLFPKTKMFGLNWLGRMAWKVVSRKGG